MKGTPQFLLVDANVLPDVFTKVCNAKRLLALGQAKSASEAARMAGISRSAFYQYKDSVYMQGGGLSDNIVTISAILIDKPGVLSVLIGELYKRGANVLTINQNIPVDGVAPVSVSIRTDMLTAGIDHIITEFKEIPGVVDVKRISG